MEKRQRHPYTYRLSSNEAGLVWLHRIFVLDNSHATAGHWHSHHDMEIICRLDGEQRYEIADHPDLTQKQGQILIIPAEVRHRLAHEIDGPGKRICLFIRMDDFRIGRDAIFTNDNLRHFRSRLQANALQPFPGDPAVLQDFNELAGLVRKRHDKLAHWEWATARVLVCDIVRRLASRPETEKTTDDALIDEALAWMEKNAAERFSMTDLLKRIGYGQTRFYELFRAHTGLTPNAWLMRHRIQRASSLLRSTDLSAAAVGRTVGYADTAYFFATFKRLTGFTPTAFRNKGKGR